MLHFFLTLFVSCFLLLLLLLALWIFLLGIEFPAYRGFFPHFKDITTVLSHIVSDKKSVVVTMYTSSQNNVPSHNFLLIIFFMILMLGFIEFLGSEFDGNYVLVFLFFFFFGLFFLCLSLVGFYSYAFIFSSIELNLLLIPSNTLFI